MATNNNQKLAVLIDADNAQASVIQELLAEVSRYGTATIKRAYGDWTTTNLKGWKEVLHKMAIQPIQQFSYTTGKNSTDASLIIDAMDVLHTGSVDGFCLVSSDSDFTRLATRIREAGLVVYGFGERKTPEPFVAACDKFIYTEILRNEPEEAKLGQEPVAELPKLKPMLLNALTATVREDGWSTLSALGSQITRSHPSFDPRNYGVAKLGELIRLQAAYLEVKEVKSGEGDAAQTHLHVRRKLSNLQKA
jgi:NYN domain/OST-HTH/LOTUS domain